jgi:hypothetical protein
MSPGRQFQLCKTVSRNTYGRNRPDFLKFRYRFFQNRDGQNFFETLPAGPDPQKRPDDMRLSKPGLENRQFVALPNGPRVGNLPAESRFIA